MNEVAPPRISRGRAAVTVVAGLALTGVAIGVLWAFLAPAVHGVVALNRDGERVRAHLGSEADHFFIAAFLVVGMLSAMAVIAAVLVWQWRAHRGPLMVAALACGAAAAAGAAAGVGAALVHWRYGSIDVAGAPISPDHRVHYVIEAPPVFFGHSPMLIALTLLFPAAIAALVYSLIAVSVPRDDLGAWPPVEDDELGPVLTAGNVPPSGQ
ncbi:DUF2567 domain-containing protein [Mycobacterium sp. 2YAF39]|uniref:DUF2567 domain-containing protein n=1 Tax=Mycobacterium sp. 2YAF39 TaxID=3233033 RepID=UPI003F97FC67